MKKILFLSAMCALLATGCTQKQDSNDDWKPGTVEFVIKAANADGTRAFYSEEDIEPNIATVNVYVFDDAGLYLKTISVDVATIPFGTPKTLEEGTADHLEAGTYSFLAVGFEDGATATLIPIELAIGTTTMVDFKAQFATQVPDDTFSGTATETVTALGGRIEITISRLVSGILGYFTNIPQELEGKTVGSLKLTMSDSDSILKLGDGTSESTDTTPYDVFSFDFTGAEVDNGVYTGNATTTGAVQLPNSYLDGKFVVPIGGVTLTLTLYDNTPVTPVAIHSWSISGPEGTTIEFEPGKLYTLGQKKAYDSTDGGTGDDPDPTPEDDDRGIDLLTTQDLVIDITTEWGDPTILDMVP